jgi:hypothetical protein
MKTVHSPINDSFDTILMPQIKQELEDLGLVLLYIKYCYTLGVVEI